MDYAKLGYVEAIEDLADGAGMELPARDSVGSSPSGKDWIND